MAALLTYNLHRIGEMCADLDNFAIFIMIFLSACFSFSSVMCLGEALHAIDIGKEGRGRANFIKNAFKLGAVSLLIGLGGSLYMSRFCL